jgi:squalene-hopene/tetraprenyl-beta-curcumene cyclase
MDSLLSSGPLTASDSMPSGKPELTALGSVETAIEVGCQWLVRQQNRDGGFGDTDRSHSNIATTLLVVAAWRMAGWQPQLAGQISRAESYVESNGSWQGLRRRYGRDKTFVVPILSNCALAGMVSWQKVQALPFEAAWLPQDWYRLARMPVVSYAVPALVAIGQARFHFAPPRNPFLRWLRRQAAAPTLDVLRRMQPASGGYLEAVPLTSFVLMNLAAIGHHRLPVAQHCLKFLLDSRLEDGSWPIDTNLASWVTSLSLVALAAKRGRLRVSTPAQSRRSEKTRDYISAGAAVDASAIRWLLRCQHTKRHPFTGANPGGWGWTNLSGAVPDADDTPAALLALGKLDLERPSCNSSAMRF